ncbi:MAG: radical SAM protein [Desulfobacterales bacterium]|nr:radical SAM protein [Desulfobacterales bacterium]
MARRNSTLNRYLGYIAFAFATFVLRRKNPYLFILVINDKCNLDCFYCSSKNTGKYDLGYTSVRSALSAAYGRGCRALVITGGEPMMWRDRHRAIHDAVAYAKRLGFHDIALFTNGTHPLDIADITFIVTIDGTKEIHDAIRGRTYDAILANVEKSKSPVIASITLSKTNADTVEKAIREIDRLGGFAGITFNLLTHNPDVVARHGLLGKERHHMLDRMWALKRQGYPIILSRAAYRALKSNNWRRPIAQIALKAGNRIFTCCRDVDNPDICRNCGYSSCAEISQALACKPSAIYQLLKTI